jgi:hypothetical protein
LVVLLDVDVDVNELIFGDMEVAGVLIVLVATVQSGVTISWGGR